MLPHRVVVAIFLSLVSQGRLADALPIGPFESYTNGEYIFGRDAPPIAEKDGHPESTQEYGRELETINRRMPAPSFAKEMLETITKTMPTTFATQMAQANKMSQDMICDQTKIDQILQIALGLQQYNADSDRAASSPFNVVKTFVLPAWAIAALGTAITMGAVTYWSNRKNPPMPHILKDMSICELAGPSVDGKRSTDITADKINAQIKENNRKKKQEFASLTEREREEKHITWKKLEYQDLGEVPDLAEGIQPAPDHKGPKAGPKQLVRAEVTGVQVARQLKIMADALHASYQVKDGRILIQKWVPEWLTILGDQWLIALGKDPAHKTRVQAIESVRDAALAANAAIHTMPDSSSDGTLSIEPSNS